MRVWPAAVLAAVFALVGVWAFIGVQNRMGLDAGNVPRVKATGSAEVRSCSRNALDMWLTWKCDAQVTWPGKPTPVAERVRSVHELTGTVAVNERIVPSGGRFSTAREVAAADYPTRTDGTLFFLMMIGFLVGGLALGFFLGWQLEARFMPEPPEKPEKLKPMSKKRSRRRSKG